MALAHINVKWSSTPLIGEVEAMKAVEAKFLSFLDNAPQFVIPIYQRTYSWTIKECQQLWDDILKAGKTKDVSAHFIGSIVYIEKGLYHISTKSPLLVIDGQQRLTTVMLLIEALARSLGNDEPLEGFSAEKLRDYYLINALEKDEKKYKLILSQTDKASFFSKIGNTSSPKDYSIRIDENFTFFEEQLKKTNKETVCNGLAKLLIVDISLNRDHDNPQLIFESLNSTGRELTQADLIRNYVLMELEPEFQTRLYVQYWRPMELEFGQTGYSTDFDRFMRHYLTVKTGEIPKIREVYDAFKEYEEKSQQEGIEKLVSDLYKFAVYYCAMAFQTEKVPELKKLFQDIKELKVDVAYPLLLELYDDYANEILSRDELAQAGRLIESYVFRRSVCDIPTNSMNKTFATFSRELKKDRYLESIKARFLLLPSYRRFPRDEELKQKIQLKDLYNFRNRSYWLRRLENHERKERVAVHEYTIEHIMPQNKDLSEEWKNDLGLEWERIHDSYLHTIGNLTLTGYNPEYSDRPFREKCTIEGGFVESPIHLNQGLGNLKQWNEHTIHDRAKKLAEKAIEVWKQPQLDPKTLETYEKPSPKTSYSIEDHERLVKGPISMIFQELRKQVLAIDPCITEEFLKVYVAYKAETNFVDIVPQAKRLRLSLNMHFHEIDDPRGICKDVTNLGRWGNGDVEVGLQSLDELPYLMGLIRQAFDRQMGNEEII